MPLFVPSILVLSFFPFLFLRVVDVTLFVVDHVLSECFVLFCFFVLRVGGSNVSLVAGELAMLGRAFFLLFLSAGQLPKAGFSHFVPYFALIYRDRFVCIICTVSGFGFEFGRS